MEFPICETRYEHVNAFVNELAPIVCNEYLRRRAAGQKTISPAVVLAQAGKESGWNLDAPTLFGIKGDGVELNTSEFIGGEYIHIKDSFAAYPNIAGAVQGYYDLMQWDNYDDATSADTVEGELEGLTNDVGYAYATAPDYYETTLAIIDNFDLRKYNDYVNSVEISDTASEDESENVPGESTDETLEDNDPGRTWDRDVAERVTEGLYVELLGRDYDANNEGIIHGLEYDMTRWQAFLAIFNSDECQKKLKIKMMFQMAFGRMPSNAELDEWFNRDDIHEILYTSEFDEKYEVH